MINLKKLDENVNINVISKKQNLNNNCNNIDNEEEEKRVIKSFTISKKNIKKLDKYINENKGLGKLTRSDIINFLIEKYL